MQKPFVALEQFCDILYILEIYAIFTEYFIPLIIVQKDRSLVVWSKYNASVPIKQIESEISLGMDMFKPWLATEFDEHPQHSDCWFDVIDHYPILAGKYLSKYNVDILELS